ncbi:SpoIIE family protein phosphatase [Leptospira sp. 2 VSF19]|uniref:SpoIIE family protein phosphatase n=1 Tax=Leptospira soteropolitanensis TaxID=2950025 RepID=A0AAW5VD59_9LEPT|nr:GAF domain-containing SpoIIE family protein phosphatase [Leptospira soteropolitanensis]MCW7492838.1 SpoIIE family protein phosphatase [Leptospira soteropolitanensis]MCW7500073.1 SpoIIE family protein phosphatase [Leptospira soteropolitanensis]MCW7522324.1 SpoIIE family protein phosphatase [Leptospira soteropolitanensis]MCW7526180.1 SpoIIE family protein phosphatase [Leptospira soteropolitanensis]MCW7529708.1 SpoIIE family protein phosphatase [Leptospira soteropolitanensis]
MISRKPDYGRYQHLESFIHLSKDAIWCYELDIPMPISLSQEEQLEYIWNHSVIRECNLAMAKFYGYQAVQDIFGKYLKDLVTLKSVFLLRRFIESSYQLENYEYFLELSDGHKRVFLMNSHGQVEEGFLLRIWGQQIEISSIRESEFKLSGLLQFSQIVTEVSKTFVHTKAELVSDAIQFALEELGKYSRADRVFAAEISSDKQFLSVTHEWVLVGMPSLFSVGTKLSIAKMNPERLGILASDGVIHIADTTQMVDEPWHLDLFKRAEVRSILVVGLRDEGSVIGILGITTYDRIGFWSEETKRLLGLVAGFVSQGLVRAKNEIKLMKKEKILQRFYSDVKEDLALAKLTQEAWVAKDFGEIPNVKIQSRFLPYDEIGGDLILYEKHSEECIDIFFGDISGHGISSALVSGIAAVSFKKHSKLESNPSAILSAMHLDLKTIIFKHHISACVLRLFPRERRIEFSFAGHPPVVFWKENERVMKLVKDEMYPILLLDFWEGKTISKTFEPGDRLLLYSDGIYELEEEGGGYIGLDVFLQELSEMISVSESTDTLIQKMITNCLIDKDRIIHDDIAVLSIEF